LLRVRILEAGVQPEPTLASTEDGADNSELSAW